jgi:hypothetical protein
MALWDTLDPAGAEVPAALSTHLRVVEQRRQQVIARPKVLFGD